MREKIIICAIDRKSVENILEFINTNIEVIGYCLETNDNEEIYTWLDNFEINCNFLNDNKETINKRMRALQSLIKALLQDTPKTISIPITISGDLSNWVEKIIQTIEKGINNLEEQENLEKVFCQTVNILENILEYIYFTYKLIKLYPLKKILLEEIEWLNADAIFVYNGETWAKLLKGNVLFFQEFLYFYWGISPERYNLLQEFEDEEKEKILGLVTGMSYTQRGINIQRLIKKTSCIGAPSQDLFYDYLMCKFACEQCENIEFCVIGISPYSLWYDMSLSKSTSIRSLYYYEQTGTLHHLENKEYYQMRYKKAKEIYDEVLKENTIKKLFEDMKRQFHLYEAKDLQIYSELKINNEGKKEETIENIKQLFNKLYEKTYLETIEILDRFLKYLKTKNIRTIILIPPYPNIFIENMSENMLNKTIEVIENFKQKYKFTFLNFIGDRRFEEEYFSDYSHLNYFGANLMADILNLII